LGFLGIALCIPIAAAFVVVTLTGEHFGLVRLGFFSVRFFGGDVGTALDVLNARYARGEIDQAEYQEKRALIASRTGAEF
jgi:uncharacterized membrane protein